MLVLMGDHRRDGGEAADRVGLGQPVMDKHVFLLSYGIDFSVVRYRLSNIFVSTLIYCTLLHTISSETRVGT